MDKANYGCDAATTGQQPVERGPGWETTSKSDSFGYGSKSHGWGDAYEALQGMPLIETGALTMGGSRQGLGRRCRGAWRHRHLAFGGMLKRNNLIEESVIYCPTGKSYNADRTRIRGEGYGRRRPDDFQSTGGIYVAINRADG